MEENTMKKFIAMVLTVVMALSLVACGGEKVESHELKMGRVLGAAHGTKCFATAVAVVVCYYTGGALSPYLISIFKGGGTFALQ